MAVIALQVQQRIPFVDRDGRLNNEGLRIINSIASQIAQIVELYGITGGLQNEVDALEASPVIARGSLGAFPNGRLLVSGNKIAITDAGPGGNLAVSLLPLTTDDVTEGASLYFTTARARNSISGSATVTYSNVSGIISLTNGNVISALGFTPYDAANPSAYVNQSGARSAISAGTGLTYNAGTGVMAADLTFLDARYISSGGASYLNIRTITSTTAPAATDYTLLCDATSGAITVNLPAASGQNKRILTIKKIDASANSVTIDPNGAELIDGATTLPISTQWQSMTVQCNGTSWWVI